MKYLPTIKENEQILHRLDTVELKVDRLDTKIDNLSEAHVETLETVGLLGKEFADAKDHYAFMRRKLNGEIYGYRRAYVIGVALIALLLLYIISQI